MNKNYSFVNKLQYWSGYLKGSDGYWRQKIYELNEWIFYHLEQLHGPPTLFNTLSCAEYWWPDLQRLLMSPRDAASSMHHSSCVPGSQL